MADFARSIVGGISRDLDPTEVTVADSAALQPRNLRWRRDVLRTYFHDSNGHGPHPGLPLWGIPSGSGVHESLATPVDRGYL